MENQRDPPVRWGGTSRKCNGPCGSQKSKFSPLLPTMRNGWKKPSYPRPPKKTQQVRPLVQRRPSVFALSLNSAACNDNRASCNIQLLRVLDTIAPRATVGMRGNIGQRNQPIKSRRGQTAERHDKHKKTRVCVRAANGGGKISPRTRMAWTRPTPSTSRPGSWAS